MFETKVVGFYFIFAVAQVPFIMGLAKKRSELE